MARARAKRKRFDAVDCTRRFVQSADELCKSDAAMAKCLKDTLAQLLEHPESPGLHREPIHNDSLGDLHSSRVRRDTRLIDREAVPGRLRALNVGSHDPVYRWAERYHGAGHDDIVETVRLPEAEAAMSESSDPPPDVSCFNEDCPTSSGILLADAQRLPRANPGQETFDGIPLNEMLALGIPRHIAKRVREAWVETSLRDYGFSEAMENAILDSYFDHSADSQTASASREPSFVPLPIPLRGDDDIVVSITEAGQFERMAELGLDRYLMVLSDEQRRLAELAPSGMLVVKGSAGSGKTAVAVHRVRFLAEHIARQPALVGEAQRRVLYLCYNSALANAVEQMVATLYGGYCPDIIQVRTLHAWAREYLVARGVLARAQNKVTTERYCRVGDDMEGRVANLVAQRLKPGRGERTESLWARLPAKFFADEITQIILGRGLTTMEEYLTADRRGRRVPLSAADRGLVWRLYLEYRDSLERHHRLDLAMLPWVALEYVREDGNFIPYEAVVVDEAQDFTPLRLRLAAAIAGAAARLSIFGDAAQTLYRTGFSWKLAELSPRGAHVKSLERNFRNTREIYEAASALLAGSDGPEDEDAAEGVAPLPNRVGPIPLLLECDDSEGERAELCRRIRAQVDAGVPPQNIAVLCGINQMVESAADALLTAGLPVEAIRRNGRRVVSIAAPSMKVLTMHSAKGLDFPHVYLAGLTSNGLPGKYTGGEDDDEVRGTQRRLLYTSMCRAGQTLTLSTIRGQEHPLLADLPPALCSRRRV